MSKSQHVTASGTSTVCESHVFKCCRSIQKHREAFQFLHLAHLVQLCCCCHSCFAVLSVFMLCRSLLFRLYFPLQNIHERNSRVAHTCDAVQGRPPTSQRLCKSSRYHHIIDSVELHCLQASFISSHFRHRHERRSKLNGR